MSNKAVIAFVFDDPDDLNTVRYAVAISRQLFDGPLPKEIKLPAVKKVENLNVFAAVGEAADTIAFFVDNGELPVGVPEESNWERHARRELEIIGEDPDMIDCMCKTLRAYSSFGHSGGSHAAVVPMLMELLQFHNLSPLTNDPAEWNKIADEMAGQPDVWQSQRNPEAFSNDGGKTHYLVSDKDRVLQTSAEKK